MKGTTNFEEFFEDVGDLNSSEVHHLYQAIQQGCSVGRWDASRRSGKVFVHGESVTLCIVDGQARSLFLQKLQTFTDQPELNIDDWAMRREAMQRDD